MPEDGAPQGQGDSRWEVARKQRKAAGQWAAQGQPKAKVPLLWGLCWEPWGGRVLIASLGGGRGGGDRWRSGWQALGMMLSAGTPI